MEAQVLVMTICYYFDDSKFKKKEITTKKILSVYELDELLKNEQFNAVKFMELVERKLDDQHYGKATNSYIRKSPNIFLLQFQNFINKLLFYRVKLSSWDDEN